MTIKEFKDSAQKIEECSKKIDRMIAEGQKEEERKKQEEQLRLQEKARSYAEQRQKQKKEAALEKTIEVFSVLASIAIVGIYLLYVIIAKPYEKVEACDAETFSVLFKFLFSMTKPVGVTAFLIGIVAGIEVGRDVLEELRFKFWVCAGSQIAIVLITMFSHGGGLVPVLMLIFAIVRSLIGVISFFISKFITHNICWK